MTTELTDQIYFEVRDSDKFDALTRIIDTEPEFYGIVFSRTKVGVDELVNRLTERGYAAEGLHGDVSQGQREKILRKFKKKLANILVATDVAARGIDINNLTHVINYSLPQDTESYVHRIGRTGRAGNTGTAVTFISPAEFRQFGYLRRDIKAQIKKESLPSAQDVIEIKKTRSKTIWRKSSRTDRTKSTGKWAAECFPVLRPKSRWLRCCNWLSITSSTRAATRDPLDQCRPEGHRSAVSGGRQGGRVRCPQAGRASGGASAAARRQDRRSAGAGELFVRIGSVLGGPRGDRQAERHSPGRTADRRLAKESAPQKEFRHDRPAGNKGAGRNTGGRREVRPAGKTERTASRGRKEPSVESIEWDAISWGTAPSPKKEAAGAARAGSTGERSRRSERSADSGPCARRVTNWHGN